MLFNYFNLFRNSTLLLVLLVLCSSFDLPNEKKYIGRKVENIEVRDAKGNTARLLDNLNGKPLVLSPVYTRCPMACSYISGGLLKTVETLGTLGSDFNILTFSFDSTDTKEDLAAFEKRWKMNGVDWKTVTAGKNEIASLLNSIDYKYDYDEKSNEYGHPNLVLVVTPSGRISRYIYGIEPKPKDLKLAIMEAQVEKTSFNNFLQTIYVRCFTFNPTTKSYHIDWRFISQTSVGLLFIVILGTLLIRNLYSTNNDDLSEAS